MFFLKVRDHILTPVQITGELLFSDFFTAFDTADGVIRVLKLRIQEAYRNFFSFLNFVIDFFLYLLLLFSDT
jgi:hypothetical protein